MTGRDPRGNLRPLTRKHLMEEAWATPPSSQHNSPNRMQPRSSSVSAEMTCVCKGTHTCIFGCAHVCVHVCGSAASGSPPVSSAEPLLGGHPRGHSPHPCPGLVGRGAAVAWPGSSALCPWGLATGLPAQPWRTRSLHVLRAARPSCRHRPGPSPRLESLAVTLARSPQEPERLEEN